MPPEGGIALDGVEVAFGTGAARMRALLLPRFEVAKGARVALKGPSGSGKSTLLNLIAGLLAPSAGSVRVDGVDVGALSEGARDAWRRRNIGFVFQDVHLVPELSVLGNIVLPATFSATRVPPDVLTRAADFAAGLGLADLKRRAAVLSRGEQQRVAIARALLHRPALILADEPTASLDQDNAARIAALLTESAKGSGATLLVASHDPVLLRHFTDLRELVAGAIASGAAA